MRKAFLLLGIVLLTGCTAKVSTGIEGEKEYGLRFFPEAASSSAAPEQMRTYIGKFATASAVNSGRSFLSEYYGNLEFTAYPNGKIECAWNLDGRRINAGVVHVLHASSTVCVGRLQKDSSFDFAGTYVGQGMNHSGSGAENANGDRTFSLAGRLVGDEIDGSLLLGDVFRGTNPPSATGADLGVAFVIVQADGSGTVVEP